MEQDHQIILKKTIASQTWNKKLADALIAAIDEITTRPKPIKGPSALQLAVEAQRRKRSKSVQDISTEISIESSLEL